MGVCPPGRFSSDGSTWRDQGSGTSQSWEETAAPATRVGGGVGCSVAPAAAGGGLLLSLAGGRPFTRLLRTSTLEPASSTRQRPGSPPAASTVRMLRPLHGPFMHASAVFGILAIAGPYDRRFRNATKAVCLVQVRAKGPPGSMAIREPFRLSV